MVPKSIGGGARSFSAVIFDMDGLLVDSEPIWHEAERDVARAWGAKWTDEDARACTGKGIPNTAERLAEAAGVAFETRHTDYLIETFLRLAERVPAKPGAKELVVQLRRLGVPLGLGSSSPRRVVDQVTQSAGFAGAFAAMVTADDVTHVKPAPDIFLACAERLGVPREQCVVLEDSATGIRAARAASMYAIAVPEGAPDDVAPVADLVVETLHDAYGPILALLSRS